MAYTPTYATWHDWPTVDTPITAAAIQAIDDQLVTLTTDAVIDDTLTVSGTGLQAVTFGDGSGLVAGSNIDDQSHIIADAVADDDTNEWGLTYMLNVSGTYTAPREKFALVGYVVNKIDDATNYGATGGVYGRAVTWTANENAHLWGGLFECWTVSSGAGGQMLGVEIGLHSHEIGGALDTATAKVGLWIRCNTTGGLLRGTAMIANTNDTSSWLYGLALRQVTDTYIRLYGATDPATGINMSEIDATSEGINMGGNTIKFAERTDASAPAANNAVIYARDTGGKTELVARFASGDVQQIAIQP